MSLARDNQVIRTTIRFHSRETSERNPARLRLSESGKSLAPPLLNGRLPRREAVMREPGKQVND